VEDIADTLKQDKVQLKAARAAEHANKTRQRPKGRAHPKGHAHPMSALRETDGDEGEPNAWTFVAAVLSTVLAVIMGILWLNPRQRCVAEAAAKTAQEDRCE
jgi:hypothetical protein